MIRFFNVGKRYFGDQLALSDLTFHIPRGELVFLTGASGAGKTTLLKLIFRQEAPTTGQILVNGRNVSSIPESKIPYLRRTIGVVFQDFRLIPRQTVLENVTFLPRILGMDLGVRKRLAFEALRRVGLADRANAFPQHLSGGEQQRVAIARAIINEPELLIADEPTGNLDPDLSREIVRLFLEINRRGTTVILATHDRDLIHRVGGRILTLDHGRLVGDQTLPASDPDFDIPGALAAESATEDAGPVDVDQAPAAPPGKGGEAEPVPALAAAAEAQEGATEGAPESATEGGA